MSAEPDVLAELRHRVDTLSSALRLALGPVPLPGRVPPAALADAMTAPSSAVPSPVELDAGGHPVTAWVSGGSGASAVTAWSAVLDAVAAEADGRVPELACTDLTAAIPLVVDSGRFIVSVSAHASERKAAMRAARQQRRAAGTR